MKTDNLETAQSGTRNFIYCPECECYTSAAKWKVYECYCEDCGDHPGTQCPNCSSVFDLIYSELMYVEIEE